MRRLTIVFSLLVSLLLFNVSVGAEAVEKSNFIRLSFNGNEIIVKLSDIPESREFLQMLPMSVSFQDYVGKEKIAILPKKLKDVKSGGHKPEVGDFTYYIPWGNLAVFYGANSYSNTLIPLGKIYTGLDKLNKIDGDFEVLIERVD